MTKKELKKDMLAESQVDLLRLLLTEEYLTERIKQGETKRQPLLSSIKNTIKETKKLIVFFKK